MYRWLLLILLLVAIGVGLVVGVLNPDAVALDLLFVQWSLPLGALVLGAMMAGVLIGLVLAFVMFVVPGRLTRRRGEGKQGGSELTGSPDA
ncbi:MAG: lipopolysaccharide assembly protein LapA domain-containing protein [Wenzhouxiangella sp.]